MLSIVDYRWQVPLENVPMIHRDSSDGPVRPVPRRVPASRRSQVLDLLREAILDGTLPPGEHLKQDSLCAQFGLSPTPVREALRDLESEGLVEHFPHHGVVVTDITSAELLALLVPVRLAIESFALPLAAERMSDEDWARLEAIVEEMGRQAQSASLVALNDLDVAFHQTAIAASGSPHADQLWRSVLPRIRVQFRRLAPLHRELSEIQEEHRRLLTALKSRDAETIVAALQEHILGSTRELLERAG
jgi:DNA-binding GntR family transcriptional regulator